MYKQVSCIFYSAHPLQQPTLGSQKSRGQNHFDRVLSLTNVPIPLPHGLHISVDLLFAQFVHLLAFHLYL